MQITKAMELVASSKLRRAKERVENSRPYFETLYATLFEYLLKQRGHRLVRTATTLCNLLTVVGLNTFNFEFERLEHMFKENG